MYEHKPLKSSWPSKVGTNKRQGRRPDTFRDELERRRSMRALRMGIARANAEDRK